MNNLISVVIAASNDQDLIQKTLESLNWVVEIIVILANTTIDNTKSIVSKYTKHIFISDNHLGHQRNIGLLKSKGQWILILDTDEVVSDELAEEIKKVTKGSTYNGYLIPYQNYFCNRKLLWGNQKYKKLRLFKRKFGYTENLSIHPDILVNGPVGMLKGKILHYSFRSIPQTLRKFTYYASIEAKMKNQKGERTTLKKLTLYPLHMFWSIFIDDQGYRDGIWGFLLAVCFAYYELARYVFLLLIEIREHVLQ